MLYVDMFPGGYFIGQWVDHPLMVFHVCHETWTPIYCNLFEGVYCCPQCGSDVSEETVKAWWESRLESSL